MWNLETVSYTHLDVYKRQDKKHPLYNKLDINKNTNYYIQDRYINIYFNPYKQSGDNTQYEFKIPYNAFKNKIEVFNNFFLINIETVSYTHLDVYKRQL